MAGLRDPLYSTALSNHSDRLRALFSPITAEVRKGRKVLEDDEGSFYQSSSFKWNFYLKDFLDCYHNICDRKQVEPIYLEPELKSALKVPFASIETLRLLQESVVKRLLQLRERRIPPFNKLPEYPAQQDIDDALKASREDKDIHGFLYGCSLLPKDLSAYIRILEKLSGAYSQRVNAFVEALSPTGSDEKAKLKLNESRQKIRAQLDPYIKHLKTIGALPSGWIYPFKRIPLVEAERIGKESGLGVDKSAIDHITKYWEADMLPPRKKVELSAEEKNRIFSELWAAALKEREHKILEVEERPAPKPSPRPAPKPAPKPAFRPAPRYHPYRKSAWRRFNEWVSGIGNWFAYKMDDIAEWMMRAWIWLLAAFLVISVILVWVNEGLFTALLAVGLLFLIIGILSGVLEAIVALISLVVKYVTYVPLFILRCIFYRGWTFLLTVLGIGGYVTYLVLEMTSRWPW
jgi:hypothetical protein